MTILVILITLVAIATMNVIFMIYNCSNGHTWCTAPRKSAAARLSAVALG